jgi:hypothetical protein
VFWLLSSHLAIIVLTINQVFVAISLSFTGSPIHPPSRCSHYHALFLHIFSHWVFESFMRYVLVEVFTQEGVLRKLT